MFDLSGEKTKGQIGGFLIFSRVFALPQDCALLCAPFVRSGFERLPRWLGV